MSRKSILNTVLAIILALNIGVMPIVAADDAVATSVEPRLNNISAATLSLGFDTNNVAYCGIVLNPYSHCTGMDGMMRLFDENGTQLKSWAIYDHEEPYSVENTWQVEYGGTYTVTFQGYAYGSGTMYDEINLSVTGTCTD